MELHDLEKVLEYIEAIQESVTPTVSRGSALMLMSELKLTSADKLPAICQQLELVDVAGRKLSYQDNFKVVAKTIEIIVAAENGDKVSGSE